MEKQKPLVKNKLSQKITACSLDKDTLHILCNLLQERSYAAGDIEVSNFDKREQTDEEYEKNKKILKDSFELRVTVVGKDGEEFFGPVKEVFESPNFPDQINSIYINSETVLKANHNWSPRNSFDIFLDFTKPEIFNFSLMPSQATPNNSNFNVSGYDATWANGVFNEILKILSKNKSSFSFLHRHSIYDIFLWFVGYPLAFWICFKFSPIINQLFGNISVFIKSGAYLYLFIASLFIFRVLFHYGRWIWPLVEYKCPKDKALKHRAFFSVLLLSLLGTFIYDLVKHVF